MDILLTHGYFLALDEAEQGVMRPYPPLGLLYLSAYLKRAGFQVEVFDSTFSEPAELKRFIQDRRPPVVGIYGNLMTRPNVIRIMAWCREVGAKVVLGGPEPQFYAAEYLRRGADIVVAGEGEVTLEEILVRFLSADAKPDWNQVSGISFLQENGPIATTAARTHLKDLDQLPFPDREAIRIDHYLGAWRERHGEGAVSLITSRGCPYTCSWCSHGVFGYSYRCRSPENVADEIEIIQDRYRPDLLWFADDVFTMNRRWLNHLAGVLEQRRLRLPFETITREDRIDEEIVRTLAEMGCRRIWVGAESGSQMVLDAMQRKTDAERVSHVIALLRRHGIETGMFIMLGYEGEEEAEIFETTELLKRARPDVFLTTVAYPIKGTPYYDQVEDRVLSPATWDRISDRDLTIRGRHSRRYYRHVQRWMNSEVLLNEYRLTGKIATLPGLRAQSGAWLGRLGMHWTRGEKEG